MMSRLFDLAGKVALVVINKDGGLGDVQAVGLATFGADVAVAGTDIEGAKVVADKVRKLGRETMVLGVDVTQEPSVEEVVKQVLKRFQRIDILVNDFSTRIRKPATDFPVEEWQQVMDYNIRGCFICCKVVGREMVKQRSGKIINHSSVRGQYGLPGGYAAYCSSKGAIDTLTKQLAVEWAPYKVLVNAIAPTFVNVPTKPGDAFGETDSEFIKMVTARIPMGRWGTLEDYVGPTIFLASKASDFVTGQILYVDGGVTAW
jgi:NAD(P)-dependent dehydrogenase (short-subunit alcohol dehydrogenase family)